MTTATMDDLVARVDTLNTNTTALLSAVTGAQTTLATAAASVSATAVNAASASASSTTATTQAAAATTQAAAAATSAAAAVVAQNNAVAVVTGGTASLTAAVSKLPITDAGALLDPSWARSLQSDYPSIRPSLHLDFANSKVLDPRITFTRASVGSYFDSKGVLQLAASGVPRFDHDAVTGECKGLLIEDQRTNLMTYSAQFDNAAWTKTNCSILTAAAVAPDGSMTACKLVGSTVANQQTVSGADVAAGTYARSVYAKAGELPRLGMTAYSSADGYFCNVLFDLSAGTVVSGVGGAIASVGGGWYRCSVCVTSTAATQYGGFSIRPAKSTDTGGATAGPFDGTSGVYIWGAQCEVGNFPTSYIPTVAAQVTRASDVANMTGTNFSSWYRQSEGTLYAESVPIGTYGSSWASAAEINNGTQASNIIVGSALSYTAGVAYKLVTAHSQSGSSSVSYRNGVAGGGYVTNPLLTNTQLLFATGQLYYTQSVYIKKLAFYPKRLSTAELLALTA